MKEPSKNGPSLQYSKKFNNDVKTDVTKIILRCETSFISSKERSSSLIKIHANDPKYKNITIKVEMNGSQSQATEHEWDGQ